MAAADAITAPDVLVLGAGGTLGIAWTQGLLAGIEDACGADFRRPDTIVGTSAGAFVAASLAAGRRPARPSATSEVLPLRGAPRRRAATPVRVARALATPWAGPALSLARPGGQLVRAAGLRLLPAGRQNHDGIRDSLTRAGAQWDGRLRVCAVDRRTGRRVVFGAPGAPRATVADAVAASCAVPWIFAPVRIDGREYVDGAMWSVTNLDIAPAGERSRVLCVDPTASVRVAATSPYAALRASVMALTAVEALALRARGARVQIIGPSPAVARVMGSDLMDDRRRPAVLAGGYAQGLALGA